MRKILSVLRGNVIYQVKETTIKSTADFSLETMLVTRIWGTILELLKKKKKQSNRRINFIPSKTSL